MITLTLSNKPFDNALPPIDGFGTEGLGSMLQYHLLLYFISDYLGVNFVYPGSENFAHHSYTGLSAKEFHDTVDSFFNFPGEAEYSEAVQFNDFSDREIEYITSNKDKNILVYFCNVHNKIRSWCDAHKESIFTKERVDKIRNNLKYKGERYFKDGLNICLHLRTTNPNDIPQEIASPLREYYIAKRDLPRYTNLINYLKRKTQSVPTTLHIHSQGFDGDFQELLQQSEEGFQIVKHIDDFPINDLYHMASSNVFIMSNSAFSWLASLMNSGQKIVRDNFYSHFVMNRITSNYDFTNFT